MRSIEIDNIKPPFFAPILVRRVDNTTELNQHLKQQVLIKKEASAGVDRSNMGGWQSEPDLFHWLDPSSRNTLVEIISLGLKEMMAFLVGEQELAGAKMVAWANVSKTGDYNAQHIHPGAVWSGVYYVDDGGDPEARIVFPDPRVASTMVESPLNPFTSDSLAIAPESGALILFPSWLQHSVMPYTSDGLRISVSFNITS